MGLLPTGCLGRVTFLADLAANKMSRIIRPHTMLRPQNGAGEDQQADPKFANLYRGVHFAAEKGAMPSEAAINRIGRIAGGPATASI
jgi:hypothetical protein